MRQRLWILPLIMLALAALACQPAYIYDVMSVQSVVVDVTVVGRVFATVTHETNGQQSHPIMVVGEYHYVSYDSGEHWWRWDDEIPQATTNALPLTLTSETLWLNERAIWHFPRPEFRQFFYRARANDIYFQLPEQPANQIRGGTLYVAMGTEGILMGPAPGTGSTQSWRLVNTGIDRLRPLSLSITEPQEVAQTTLLLLFAPLLPIFHAYLLYRVWLYLMPLHTARNLAIKVTTCFTVFCALQIILWLTRSTVNYVSLSIFTILTLGAISIFVPYRSLKKLGVDPLSSKWALLASGLVTSIIATIGFAFWSHAWIVSVVAIGYICMQPEARYYLERQELIDKSIKNDQLWSIDRLTIESVLTGTLATLILAAVLYTSTNIDIGGNDPTLARQLREYLIMGIFLLVITLAIRVSNWRFKRHAKQLAFANQRISTDYIGITISSLVWFCIASVLAMGLFIIQSMSSNWFASLVVLPLSIP